MALDSITSNELDKHVRVLADDSLEGRQAGTRGGYAAGNYLVRTFQAHLKPGAAPGYFQIFHPNYRNLLGQIEGTDPKLKDEWIVIGAHYDHVGYGTQKTSRGPLGFIHNGADDNASGTAAILELVEAFARSHGTRRSILFALWDGEEQGLLGSEHWTHHPTIPLEKVRFCINIDMVGRLNDRPVEVVGSRTMPGLRPLVAMANAGSDLELNFPWKIEENSDHHHFFARNIPFLLYHSGLHEDYHRPTDDVERIDIQGLQAITRLIYKSAVMVANRDSLPAFRTASRFESNRDQEEFEQALPAGGPRLGISWSVADEGLEVKSVQFGSAAHKAGLVPGQRLIELDGATLLSSSMLQQAAVRQASITLTVVNPDSTEPIKVEVPLPGKPAKIGISWRHSTAAPGVVTVVRVLPHSRAHIAGVNVGDRIYRINDQDIQDGDEFDSMIRDADLPATLLIERSGRLGERIVLP